MHCLSIILQFVTIGHRADGSFKFAVTYVGLSLHGLCVVRVWYIRHCININIAK